MGSSQESELPRVCIVGSGPGATVVALELALSGKAHVIVVDLDKCSDSYSQIKSPALKADIVGHPFGQEVTRAFGFGGSSNLWHGVLAKLDPEDWTKFDESAGCEVSKEILDCYKNLDAYFPRLAEVFKSKNSNVSKPGILYREFIASRAFSEKRFLLQRHPLRTRSLLQRLSETCQHLEVIDDAVALRLESDPLHENTAAKLIVSSRGEHIRIEADKFILAAGALETPRIVMQSAKEGFQALDNDNVGCYLTDHPWGVIGELVSLGAPFRLSLTDIRGAHGYGHRIGLRLPETVASKLNHCLALKPLFFGGYEQFKSAMKELVSTQISFRALVRIFISYSPLQIFSSIALLLSEKSGFGAVVRRALVFAYLEQPTRKESRVTLTDRLDDSGRNIPEIRWVLNESDLDEVRALQNYLTSVTNAGSNFTFEKYSLTLDSFSSGSHHAGTMRVGNSPASGVVDADLKLFGANNVYVCDLSIFPNYGNSNPTLTLCAFGLRLSRHINSQLEKQFSSSH